MCRDFHYSIIFEAVSYSVDWHLIFGCYFVEDFGKILEMFDKESKKDIQSLDVAKLTNIRRNMTDVTNLLFYSRLPTYSHMHHVKLSEWVIVV
jgi:hypothetical protein